MTKHAVNGEWTRAVELFGGAITMEIEGYTRDGVDYLRKERLVATHSIDNPFHGLTLTEALDGLLDIVAARRPILADQFRKTFPEATYRADEDVSVPVDANERKSTLERGG